MKGGFFFKISKRDFTFIREMRVDISLAETYFARIFASA